MTGLDFDFRYLEREAAILHELAHDPAWMTHDNQTVRASLVRGLTFVMLNLAANVNQAAAWQLFHNTLDDYHECCDARKLAY